MHSQLCSFRVAKSGRMEEEKQQTSGPRRTLFRKLTKVSSGPGRKRILSRQLRKLASGKGPGHKRTLFRTLKNLSSGIGPRSVMAKRSRDETNTRIAEWIQNRNSPERSASTENQEAQMTTAVSEPSLAEFAQSFANNFCRNLADLLLPVS